MTPYYADDLVSLHHGDCLDVLRTLPDASVDAVVTDPPYGLEFMGKKWDAPWAQHFTGINGGPPLPDRQLHVNPRCRSCGGYQRGTKKPCNCDEPDWNDNQAAAIGRKNRDFGAWCEGWARECLRVLKPGGHLLAFGGTRTWHRLAVAVEDAGFEMRDSIAWLYGQGFPKSLNLEGGLGTALKPAFEPVVVARKPLAGTVAANVLRHGTGALNVDACRIGEADGFGGGRKASSGFVDGYEADGFVASGKGRWPANVVLDESQAAELDKQSGTSTSRIGSPRGAASGDGWGMTATGAEYDDVGGASRFFYVAKASKDERPRDGDIAHETVKPLDLMRWLVRLVTPPGGTVLEPFAGSGTTAEACVIEGFRCIAVEREARYLPLIRARLSKPIQPDIFGGAA